MMLPALFWHVGVAVIISQVSSGDNYQGMGKSRFLKNN